MEESLGNTALSYCQKRINFANKLILSDMFRLYSIIRLIS
jgi:hypothetical protein